MNPILDTFSIEDKTVRSCEPSSLIATNHAIRDLGYKVKGRMIIRHITVEAGEIVGDKEYPKMSDVKYKVGIGFHVKDVWHWSWVEVTYHYAPESCMNTQVKIVDIKRQEGSYPNTELVSIMEKRNENVEKFKVSMINAI